MAGGHQSSTIQFWDMSSGEMLFTLCGRHKHEVTALKAINNQYLASGSKDSKVIIWNLTSAQSVTTFIDHQNEIIAIEYLSNSDLLVSFAFPLTLISRTFY